MEKKTIAILGMMCAGCAANVERKLNSLEGIESAQVNLPARTALISFDPQKISLETMKSQLATIGYDMVIEENRNVKTIEQRQFSMLKKNMVFSWIIAVAICLTGFHENNVTRQYMLLLALAQLVFFGRQFYVSAWRQLLHGSANMDSLVALSTAITFIFSTYNTFWGDSFWGSKGIEWHVYFDASAMIISFVLTGRFLEEKAKNSTASAIKSLMGLAPKTAHLVTDGTVTDTPITTLTKGDTIEVRPGEKIPVDGSLISGDAMIDESMISGESAPVKKTLGAKVLAGTIVKEGTFRFKAEKVGSDTLLAGIIKTVQEAQGSKAPVQRTVDKIALVFVPAITLISVLTFILWIAIGGLDQMPHAILSAVSVLVIACPCAMGLATPTALMVGIGKAAQKNILVKDATALENMRQVDAMVIDKTGTLTIPDETSERHEALKPHAREAIKMLKDKGIEIYMMSGDKEEAAGYWAHQAGIEHYQSEVMPQDKEKLVKQLQAAGHHVAMVGDGINDSQALATADVSIAMGRGTDVAMDVAQVTLMGDDLRRIGDAINLSKKTVGMIHQNLFWAFIYNLVCIPLAAGVLYGVADFQITPMWASGLMAMSSVSVVLNSLRLNFICK